MLSPVQTSTDAPDPQPPVSQPSRRPLQREGARYFLSTAEQAMADAMLRSSPPPETALGKRARQGEGDDPRDRTDENTNTDPDEETSVSSAQSPLPSLSNVATAALRYASKKKLRPDQRDEVDTFLLVSINLFLVPGNSEASVQDTALGRQAKLFICLLLIENKIESFRSAAPPYQLSDELKVCPAIFLTPILICHIYRLI